LPDGPFVSVIGVLGPGQGANFYHIALDGTIDHFAFNLHAYPSMKPPDEQLTVYDQTGRLIADLAPSTGSTSVTVSVPSAHLEPGESSLFVEVASAENAAGANSMAMLREEMYVLQVARFSSSMNRVAWGSGANGAAPTGLSTAAQAFNPSLPPPTSAAYEEGNNLGIVNEEEPANLIEGPVPTGPLPTRSAAPLGGVLGDGDPVPKVDRRDAVAIDLELIGLSNDELLAADGPPADAAEASGRLAELRGPGGFPLLASGSVALPLKPLAKLPALPRRWASPSVVTSDSTPTPTPTPAPTPPFEEVEAEPPSDPSLRTSIGTGLTVALTLVFGLLLPDLADAFERDEPPRDSDCAQGET
jgi:hypothetical protein